MGIYQLGKVGLVIFRTPIAAKGETVLRVVDDVITNPSLLQGKTLSEVQSIIKNTSGWKEGVMSQANSLAFLH